VNNITLITGAGRGIGLEIAGVFAEHKKDLILTVRNKKQIKHIKERIDNHKIKYKILIGDLTNINFIKKIIKKVPYVDNLIHNASDENQKHFFQVQQNEFERIVKINLKANYFISQNYAKIMVKKKIRGNIINLSSQLGHTGAYNRSLYCMAKFAIEGLTKSMAMDLGKYGIRVNSVSPTKTIIDNKEIKNKKKLNIIKNKIPLGKFSTTNEIANIVYFLTTKNANSITGTSIISDGGWTAGK